MNLEEDFVDIEVGKVKLRLNFTEDTDGKIHQKGLKISKRGKKKENYDILAEHEIQLQGQLLSPIYGQHITPWRICDISI